MSEPCVHGCPATASSSLIATGIPSSGRASPRAYRATAARASDLASSKRSWHSALTAGSTSSAGWFSAWSATGGDRPASRARAHGVEQLERRQATVEQAVDRLVPREVVQIVHRPSLASPVKQSLISFT